MDQKKLSKREARLERQAAQQLKNADKSARLRERPAPEKVVRTKSDPNSIYQSLVMWSADDPDIAGEWTWGSPRQWTDDEWSNEILPKLEEFARLTWGEIDSHGSSTGHKMHHNMDTGIICEEAQLRLMEIEKYADVIFRFRLGGKQRLWGHRILSNFEVIWFDREHMIYPTDKD